ncbi:MAG: ubiquinone/menaquinone biosynthesis methyltransferase [Acidimicrobiales bacterium]
MTQTAPDRAQKPTALVRGEEKRALVRAMFDSIAPRYDMANRLISCGLDALWRRRTADALGLPPRSRVLDLACGTGDFCRLLAGRGMRVFGVDMSEGMLDNASTDAPLVLGDALALPLRDGSVDGVVCGFALRNFVEIPPVARELARVVRPGGRIALLEVSRPSGVMSRAVYKLWFEHAVPAIGGLVSDSAAYRYLPDSVAYLPSPERLRNILRSAGFAGVGRRTFTAGATQLFTATRTGVATLNGSSGTGT